VTRQCVLCPLGTGSPGNLRWNFVADSYLKWGCTKHTRCSIVYLTLAMLYSTELSIDKCINRRRQMRWFMAEVWYRRLVLLHRCRRPGRPRGNGFSVKQEVVHPVWRHRQRFFFSQSLRRSSYYCNTTKYAPQIARSKTRISCIYDQNCDGNTVCAVLFHKKAIPVPLLRQKK
jgi:hypothetical protein